MYFDDLPVGYRFETGETTLPLDEILCFARSYDPQPFHTDAEAAKASAYGGIIASGFQTMIVAFLQTLQANVWNEASMGSPGMDEVRWRLPVRPRDRLHTVGTVVKSTPSRSKPDRGFTEIAYEVINQTGEVVMTYRATHMLRRQSCE